MAHAENGKGLGNRRKLVINKLKIWKIVTISLFQLKKTKVNGSISSLVEISPIEYYIATESNEIYLLNIKSFVLKLLKTSHKMTVHNIVFPK